MTTAAPVDFGTDLSCVSDLDPNMRETSGVAMLAEAIFRRLTTPRGGLIDDPDYGFDVRGLLSKGQTTRDQAAIPAVIRAEILKDERVGDAVVTVLSASLLAMSLSVACETADGPFELVLSVTQAKVLLTSSTVT